MPKWKQIRAAITGLLMLALLYCIYFASTLINHKSNHNHLSYIPENAEVTVILNTRKMIEQGLEDLVINSKDGSVYDLLVKEYKVQQDKSELPMGIDYSAHLAVFTLQSKEMVSGVLFSLSDPNSFEVNMPKVINRKTEVVLRKGNVGILLHRLGSRISVNEMKSLADSILSIKPSKNDNFISIDPALPVARMRYRSNGNELKLDLAVANEKLSLNGSYHSSSPIEKHSINVLAPSGLHITTTMVPDYFLNPENIGLPENLPMPKALSLNLRGSDFSTGALPMIPDADAIFYFNEDVPLRLGLLGLMKDNQIKNLTLKSFSYNGIQFYYEQLSKTSFYLGRNPFVGLNKSDQDQIVSISGSLKALTDVHAEGMMSRILSLLTMYTAGKTFAENTDNINVSMQRIGSHDAEIKGTLTFKEGKYSTVEFVRLLLSGNFF